MMENIKDKYYFISDVHLGFYEREVDKQKEEVFLQQLDIISNDAKAIYLLGDIFDYWFEWKNVIPSIYFRTLTKFYELRESGIEIYYLMGNHDFGHKDFFLKELNIPIFPNDLTVLIGNTKFYLYHGDGLSNSDFGYKILKKITRNKFNQMIYTRFLHPDFAIKLASTSSNKSRKYTDSKKFGETDGMIEFAKKKIDEGYDFVIMGHRHKKEIIEYKNAKYINLGAWFKEPSVGVFDGEHFYFLDDK